MVTESPTVRPSDRRTVWAAATVTLSDRTTVGWALEILGACGPFFSIEFKSPIFGPTIPEGLSRPVDNTGDMNVQIEET